VDEDRRKRLAWLAGHVFPHEGEVAGWLRRTLGPADDVQDVIQEAYCRICAAPDLDRIDNPRAYFFQIARGIVIDQLRRARVVRIEAVADVEAMPQPDDQPSPERITSARMELQQVSRFMANLPERCRLVLEMRKIEGLPQKEIARRLGVSEHVVENEAARGLRLLIETFGAARETRDVVSRIRPGGRRARRRD